jgi:hypothetical protein
MNDNGVVGELRAINGEKMTKYVSLEIKNRACKERKCTYIEIDNQVLSIVRFR